MDKTTKSLTISQLVKLLNQFKKQEGNLEVVLSSDPEGNSFGTIGAPEMSIGVEDGMLIMYPLEQFTL